MPARGATSRRSPRGIIFTRRATDFERAGGAGVCEAGVLHQHALPLLKSRHRLLFAAAFAGSLSSASAVIFVSTGDPAFNTTAPTGEYAGSGWDLQGTWLTDFLGTPIAPQYFITAK